MATHMDTGMDMDMEQDKALWRA